VTQKTWLAAYLYRAEPWEAFLVESVAPFVRETLDAGLADQFFFIRYWERGPHVRLRFKGDADVLENQLKPRLLAHFEARFKAHPSERTEPEWLADAPAEAQWFPNDSVQFIEYEPEVERYGGPEGMLLSETQFQASSEAVLALLNPEFDYERALGSAIQMHLAFAQAFGMSLADLSLFSDMVFRGWLLRAYPFKPDADRDYHQRMQEETLAAFKQTFASQRDGLIAFFRTLWQALEDGVEFEQEWLNRWVADMRRFGKAFSEARAQDRLELPEMPYANPDSFPVPFDTRRYWFILESFVHMTNNRLGVLNRDEAFLGYLIRETVHQIQPQEQERP